jgi:hypothetical protein
VVDPDIGTIGHSEVHAWYARHVAATRRTFTFTGWTSIGP